MRLPPWRVGTPAARSHWKRYQRRMWQDFSARKAAAHFVISESAACQVIVLVFSLVLPLLLCVRPRRGGPGSVRHQDRHRSFGSFPVIPACLPAGLWLSNAIYSSMVRLLSFWIRRHDTATAGAALSEMTDGGKRRPNPQFYPPSPATRHVESPVETGG